MPPHRLSAVLLVATHPMMPRSCLQVRQELGI